jgi:NAD(P)-dependent dehydrogenase (short-subunit alcohol dehydrogenase family)
MAGQSEGSQSANGRTVLITGGTGGLGVAVTEAFLRDDWRTVITARGEVPDALESQREPETVHADLFEEDDAVRAVSVAAQEPSAPLRAVVNLAGGFSAGPRVGDTTTEGFEEQFRLNVRPTYLVTRSALRPLLDVGEGAIVCVASRAALQPFPGAAGYAASKAAVIAFSNAVAVEYGPEGVRSNVVLPGLIDTPANRAADPRADRSKWVAPSQIAAVIRFLASADSSSVNGAAIPV